jgi:glucose-1-phosphate adenylyltransferase
VFQNLEYLKEMGSDRILILAGDHVYNMDYRKMLAFHNSVMADVTVGIVQVPLKQAHRFGTVVVKKEGRILEFIEKASEPKSNLASMGIYIFNKDVLTVSLTEDSHNPGSSHDFGYSILPEMVKKHRVFAYEFPDYWQDIGTVEAYYNANMELLRADPVFSLDRSWPVLTCNGQSTKLDEFENGRIINSLVSPGCVVKGYVENSILSPGVFVGEQARIVNSVIMDNSSIGYHSTVDRCILDEDVKIGDFCYLGFGAPSQPGVWDITLLGKEVNIPPKTAIGRKCKVLPGLKLIPESNLIISGTVVGAAAYG